MEFLIGGSGAKAARLLSRIDSDRLEKALGLRSPWDGLLVLCYHRIVPVPDQLPGTSSPAQLTFERVARRNVSATPTEFRDHLEFLTRHCSVIDPGLADQALPKRGRQVLVTFDDGYYDNFVWAAPILAEFDVAALFFICTGFVEKEALAWWDRLDCIISAAAPTTILPPGPWGEGRPLVSSGPQLTRYLRDDLGGSCGGGPVGDFLDRLAELAGSASSGPTVTQLQDFNPWMTWEQISALGDLGHSLGAHTVTHSNLGLLPLEKQIDELGGSRATLVEKTGVPVTYAAYPYGHDLSHNRDSAEACRLAGLRGAFTLGRGLARSDSSSYLLPRSTVSPRLPLLRDLVRYRRLLVR